MRKISLAAKSFGDDSTANIIARDYINNYLISAPSDSLYTKDNITFLYYFLSTKESYFNLFYNNRGKVDNVMCEKKGFARNAIDHSIYAGDIYPLFERG